MNQDLYRLIYYSRSEIQGGDESFAVEVRKILRSARARNQKADVTGALLFNGGSFGQVLEGPQGAVEATFERIQRDPRHCNVSLLAFEGLQKRVFSDWSMAFAGKDEIDAARFAGISLESGFDPARMSAERILETLRRLTIEEEFTRLRGDRSALAPGPV